MLLICSRWESKGELFINAYLYLTASLFLSASGTLKIISSLCVLWPAGDHSRPLKRATWERAKHSTPKIVTTVPKIVSQLYSSVDPSIIVYVAGRSICRVGELTPPFISPGLMALQARPQKGSSSPRHPALMIPDRRVPSWRSSGGTPSCKAFIPRGLRPSPFGLGFKNSSAGGPTHDHPM